MLMHPSVCDALWYFVIPSFAFHSWTANTSDLRNLVLIQVYIRQDKEMLTLCVSTIGSGVEAPRRKDEEIQLRK